MSGGQELAALLEMMRMAHQARQAAAAANGGAPGANDDEENESEDSGNDTLGALLQGRNRGAQLEMRSGQVPTGVDVNRPSSDTESDDADEDVQIPDGAPRTQQSTAQRSNGDIAPARLRAPQTTRETVEFYEEHGIDPSTIQAGEGPVRDEGASVAGLLEEDPAGRAVAIRELHMISAGRSRNLGPGERTTLMVRHLLLVATIIEAPDPSGMGTFGIRIRDADDEEMRLSIELSTNDQTPLQFAQSIAQRFTVGTTVAIRNFVLGVIGRSFFVMVDCADAESEIFCCGDDTIPQSGVAQLAANVDNLMEMGQHRNALNAALGAMQENRDMLMEQTIPVLTNLAVAHWKLGYKGVALAYSLTASRLILQQTPCKAAVISCKILSDMKCEVAQHVLMIKVDGDDAEEAGEDVDLMLKVSKAVAQNSVGPDDNPNVAPEHFRSKGLQETAKALIELQTEWTNHALRDTTGVSTLADTARAEHGSSAVTHLYEEGKRLYAASWVSKAILQWRAAIWLLCNRQFSPDVYYIWDILDSRSKLWERAAMTERPESFACLYLDLASLAMLRARHVNAKALENNINLAKCKLGQFHAMATETINKGASFAFAELE